MDRALRRDAPCKVNLCLDVLRRRGDGYHDMKMVMQTLSLCDTVALEEQASGFTLLTEWEVPAGQKTLEERAAEAFFQAVGLSRPGLRVTLTKRVPAYAGLGGGSADVAALLRLLREAYRPDLPTEKLEEIGFQVGSDMPFCVRGGTCLAEGRGELLTDLPPLPPCVFVLCKPPFSLPTGAMFAALDRTGRTCRPDVDGMAEALRRGDLEGTAARMENVFEAAVPAEQSGEISGIRRRMLEHGAMNACMSGSGPTVFGLFRDRDAAQRAAEDLGRMYRETCLAVPVKKLDGAE